MTQEFEEQLIIAYNKIKNKLWPPFFNQDDTVIKYLKMVAHEESEKNVKAFLGGFLYLMGLCMKGTTTERQWTRGWRQKDIANLLNISIPPLYQYYEYIKQKYGDLFNPEIYKPK